MLKDDHESKTKSQLSAFNMVHRKNNASRIGCSFLGGGLELFLSLLSAVVTLLEPEIAALLVSVVFLHVLGQRLEDRLVVGDWELVDSRVIILLEVGQGGSRLSGIVDGSLLRLTILSGEQNELGLVGGESSDVEVLHLSRLVASSLVDGDTNRSGESGGETGLFDFLKGETSSELGLGCVLLSASMNNRSQKTEGSRRDGGGLLSSLITSNLLMSGLVEEAFDTPHPVLSEMRRY